MKSRIDFRRWDKITICCGVVLFIIGIVTEPWLSPKFRYTLIGISVVLVGISSLSLLFAPRWLYEQAEDEFFSAARVRYRRRSLLAMALYVMMLFATTWLLKHGSLPANLWLRGALAVAPALPLFYAFYAYLCYVGEVDELKRRIELEAIAIGAMTVCVLSLPLAFLQMAKVIHLDSVEALLVVVPMLCIGYIVGKLIGMYRYN